MFKILRQDKKSRARTGVLQTAHGEIKTPVFMPCATHGAIKGLSPDDLETLDTQIMLGNTYHMYLRPGDKLVKKMGGLHGFMKFDRPLLTDSGGYQAFSLGERKKISNSQFSISSDRVATPQINSKNCDIANLLKIENRKLKTRPITPAKTTDEGVIFYSHLDGSKHLFTPKKVIDIQMNLGSDIMMVLDECVAFPSSHEEAKRGVERTYEWAKQSLEHFKLQMTKSKLSLGKLGTPSGQTNSKTQNPKQMLFGIIQGSTYKDLREESARQIASLPFDGIAIGGVSVGEGKEHMYNAIKWTTDILWKSQMTKSKLQTKSKVQNSKNLEFGACGLEIDKRPVYLMGVGEPEDILEGIEHGIDMFDCVLPTRLARHGTLYTAKGKMNLMQAKFREDKKTIEKDCQCYACKNGFSRSYIRHLLTENEPLGLRLATIHNLHFLLDFMEKIRYSIDNRNFDKFKKTFLREYRRS